MIKYIVRLSYHYFEFDNDVTAMGFAETAKQHYFDKSDSDLDVSISIEKVEEQKEEEKEGEDE